MTISVAKEANDFSAGDNRACSDEGIREDKCSDDMTAAEDRGCSHIRGQDWHNATHTPWR